MLVLQGEGHHLLFFFSFSLSLFFRALRFSRVSLFSLDENADIRTYVREGDDRRRNSCWWRPRGGPARGRAREKRQAGASEMVHWLRHNTERPTRKSTAVGRCGVWWGMTRKFRLSLSLVRLLGHEYARTTICVSRWDVRAGRKIRDLTRPTRWTRERNVSERERERKRAGGREERGRVTGREE